MNVKVTVEYEGKEAVFESDTVLVAVTKPDKAVTGFVAGTYNDLCYLYLNQAIEIYKRAREKP